jgi:4a-hydroxytetrahydrobiopterin dehydratase
MPRVIAWDMSGDILVYQARVTTMELTKKKCVPCEGGEGRLEKAQVEELLPQLASGWQVVDDGRKLRRQVKPGGFLPVIALVNRIAELAEAEQHHPDLAIHYDTLDITTYTHTLGGLSENDFILAAKIDQLAGSAPRG